MKHYFLLLFLTGFLLAEGQDIHFSQFAKSTFLLNPSLISFKENDYTATLQRRSQWKSVTTPFNTLTISIERKNFFSTSSYGFQFLNDIAGDSRFRTTGFNFLYAKSFSALSLKNISFGGIFGFFQRNITYSNLIFNQQENQSDFNFWFPDVSLGISNYYKIKESLYLTSGISMYHLNKPNQSLIQYGNARLNNKFNFYSTLSYFWKNGIVLTPTVLYSYSRTEQEATVVFDAQYSLKEADVSLSTSLAYRLSDAIIYSFGLQKSNLEFTVSYDFNVSSFSEATNNRGGTEFSIVYFWNVIKKEKNSNHITCPTYL